MRRRFHTQPIYEHTSTTNLAKEPHPQERGSNLNLYIRLVMYPLYHLHAQSSLFHNIHAALQQYAQ